MDLSVVVRKTALLLFANSIWRPLQVIESETCFCSILLSVGLSAPGNIFFCPQCDFTQVLVDCQGILR